jgi:hypothetical protein
MGLILDPDNNYNIEYYHNANCADLFGHEHPHDPYCVRSRTGYIICPDGCSVLWVSKFQNEVSLLTMEL